MSTTELTRAARLSSPRLPRHAARGALAVVVVATVLLKLLTGWSWAGAVVIGDLLLIVSLVGWSRVLEGPRAATDRLVTCLIWSAFLIVCVPLVWILELVVRKGASHLSWHFLTSTMRNYNANVDPTGGGIAQALVGTALITLAAAVIAIPLGIMAAIYLVEYGAGARMARVITFLVDVMTGIPSIVAGLFAVALFRIIFGPAVQMGLTGGVALALLMTPTVVRSTEEMLRLVPADLREASWALGVPKWRTILKVVLPTAIGGIVTGVMLAVSRVIGETAPLMVAVGYTLSMQSNLFSPSLPMATLPTFINNQYGSPATVSTCTVQQTVSGHCGAGSFINYSEPKYWAAALVLIVIVMVLNLVARIIGKIFAPKTGR